MALIKPEQIPDEAEEAAWNAAGDNMKAAIAAALNAWEGMVQNYNWDGSRWRIILPMPQEAKDE